MTDIPETFLLERAKRGDKEAFQEILRTNENLVYGFAFKVCRNEEYAKETLQDTFISVFRKLNQFDGRSKFSTWLYSIVAKNCLMKRRRGKLEQSSVPIGEPVMPEHTHEDAASTTLPAWKNTPLDETISSELRQIMDEAIQKLPVDYRLVFILRDVEGQSAEETAKITELSIPAVKSRLRRARVFLREQLQEYMTT
ncbi:MAG TPA: sigma-70 family RNA polymerase sigma factor [Bacteroidota bacterium]|nr:sigma-70 family RNA polymerase sigma factor [Bacteroidota bacterium]